MSYSIEEIAKTLKEARKSKGLSQRDLSVKAGVPQSHISKIENGTVDLRVSSLISLARNLGMELTLIPRKTVPVVNSIIRSNERKMGATSGETRRAVKELKYIQDSIAKIPKLNTPTMAMEKFQRQLRDIQKFSITEKQLKQIEEIRRGFQKFQENSANIKAFEETMYQTDKLRNALAHAQLEIPKFYYPRAAYSLEEDDNG